MSEETKRIDDEKLEEIAGGAFPGRPKALEECEDAKPRVSLNEFGMVQEILDCKGKNRSEVADMLISMLKSMDEKQYKEFMKRENLTEYLIRYRDSQNVGKAL